MNVRRWIYQEINRNLFLLDFQMVATFDKWSTKRPRLFNFLLLFQFNLKIKFHVKTLETGQRPLLMLITGLLNCKPYPVSILSSSNHHNILFIWYPVSVYDKHCTSLKLNIWNFDGNEATTKMFQLQDLFIL